MVEMIIAYALLGFFLGEHWVDRQKQKALNKELDVLYDLLSKQASSIAILEQQNKASKPMIEDFRTLLADVVTDYTDFKELIVRSFSNSSSSKSDHFSVLGKKDKEEKLN